MRTRTNNKTGAVLKQFRGCFGGASCCPFRAARAARVAARNPPRCYQIRATKGSKFCCPVSMWCCPFWAARAASVAAHFGQPGAANVAARRLLSFQRKIKYFTLVGIRRRRWRLGFPKVFWVILVSWALKLLDHKMVDVLWNLKGPKPFLWKIYFWALMFKFIKHINIFSWNK